MRVLVGVTGSVATIKLLELLKQLKTKVTEIKVILTNRGSNFLKRNELEWLVNNTAGVFTDENEWTNWREKGDPVLHIELRKWADLFLISPISANTLAKIAHGLCDNLLTSVVRAWDPKKPLVICPAMNTFMWENPLTEKQLETVREIYRAEVVPPKDEYILACGDRGAGAMASIDDIIRVVVVRI